MASGSDAPRDLPDRVIRQALRHPANLRAFLQQAVPALAGGFDCERGRLLDREFPLDDWRRREADLPWKKEVRDMGQTLGKTLWEEAHEQGQAKGRTEGELTAARQLLCRLLADRFGSVSEAVLQRIDSSTDVNRLMAAAVQVAHVATPEDLQL